MRIYCFAEQCARAGQVAADDRHDETELNEDGDPASGDIFLAYEGSLGEIAEEAAQDIMKHPAHTFRGRVARNVIDTVISAEPA